MSSRCLEKTCKKREEEVLVFAGNFSIGWLEIIFGVNFIKAKIKCCWSLQCNVKDIYANKTQIYLIFLIYCLRSVSKGFINDEMTESSLNCVAYDFSIDYDAIDVKDMFNIHEYVMKNIIYMILRILKSLFCCFMKFFN